ncbi:transglutaminase domain-containing protein [Micromonospora thermarum]|uniref:Transglutaminase domain-containing protein n=1 Tax=Micromonospora thermarum TaxID=2720024 RepID=A0ABX0ZAW6_9ACTN|nr:transglutaminase domain-containing protein [Micromonospora thermarum]NJP34633.1 transglutaminase domain-containing protein [Micromonospora thermarum]
MDIDDYRTHSPYSDPRHHRLLLDAVPADIATVAATARNVIVHYRAGGVELPADRMDEVNRRWVDRILDTDQSRFPLPLTTARPVADRVAGCCRDHTLLSVAVLRQHGVPARSRVGFASYFTPGWHHDHVLVEYWNGERWVWADPELDPAGAWFIYDYVLHELAHRQKDELLLWDGFGAMTGDIAGADLTLADEIAALLLAADDGDEAAEKALADRYAADARLRPGPEIRSVSPVTGVSTTVDLRRG